MSAKARTSPFAPQNEQPDELEERSRDLIAANQYWHDLLSRDRASARQQVEALNGKLAAFQVRFGPKPLQVFLKPEFIAPHERDGACRMVFHLSRLLEKAVDLYLRMPALRAEFGLSPEEEALVALAPQYPQHTPLCRMDGYFSRGRTWFLEFNVDSPAGAAYLDLIEDELLQLPIAREFQRHFVIERTPRCVVILHALLTCYRQSGGIVWPTIAIVDWAGVSTYSEFVLLRNYFERQGYPTVIADPRELEFKQGKLRHGDTEIGIVYRRVLVSEIAKRSDECRALIEAARAQAVCVVNGFPSKVAGNKALLALLTDPRFERYFSEVENRARRYHIPWTARLKEGKVLAAGKKVECLPFVRDNREHLVLKPNAGHGGVGVVLGPECDQRRWDRAIDEALKTDSVAQAYVPVPEKTIPVFEPDLTFRHKKININPFVIGGHYAGSMSRVSDSSIINVAQGGGIIPVFPCFKRPWVRRQGSGPPQF